jgi:acetyl-CoA C-acetyltransferase
MHARVFAVDGRTPVIVGVSQVNHPGHDAPEPVALLAEAVEAAASDAGVPGIVGVVDSLAVMKILSWRYRDPARLVADRLGFDARRTLYTPIGGQLPMVALHRLATDIQRGDADVAVVGGAESWRTRAAYRARGQRLPWTTEPEDVRPSAVIGADGPTNHDAELRIGLETAPHMYPLFENALRAAQALSIAEHRRRLAQLWARFSAVAAANPHAWIRRRHTADEIAAVTPANRMIAFPYTKLMNANNAVNQAAAVLLCSAERARALRIPEDRWVFPLAGAQAADTAFVSHRAELVASPGIRAAGKVLFELAPSAADAVAHVDLYSCFPSAVQIAAAELGLDVDRPLTVTGGLTFAGGPWNNYVSHSVATMVEVLRRDPGSVGLCSATGTYLTKHALGLFSTTPNPAGFRATVAGAGPDPARPLAEDASGVARVETYTVVHGRSSGAERGIAACLLDDGRRTWAASNDLAVLAAMESEEFCGRPVRLLGGGRFEPC